MIYGFSSTRCHQPAVLRLAQRWTESVFEDTRTVEWRNGCHGNERITVFELPSHSRSRTCASRTIFTFCVLWGDEHFAFDFLLLTDVNKFWSGFITNVLSACFLAWTFLSSLLVHISQKEKIARVNGPYGALNSNTVLFFSEFTWLRRYFVAI